MYANKWTWVSGDSIAFQQGIYGTRGISSSNNNNPGARADASRWVDNSGNLWLMGGFVASASAAMNDLWKFNPVSNEWTWITGDSNLSVPANFGIKGVPNKVNNPGRRRDAINWVDASGNFWLMGGTGLQNDIWKYSPSTNEWVWLGGDSVSGTSITYGTKGIPSVFNNPNGRTGVVSWKDGLGNIWLFGGYKQTNSNGPGFLNDLWKYNPSSNEWTWVNGDSIPEKPGIYGTKGVSNSMNNPGGRSDAAVWTDASGNLWLFGGRNNRNFTEFKNDLWKYNPSTNEWTWMHGDSTAYAVGIYGTKGVFDTKNKPGARCRAVSWIDAMGNLWLKGGNGLGTVRGTPNVQDVLNDLWKYNSSTNGWTWVSGDSVQNKTGVYGIKGIPASANQPGARANAVTWTDPTGNIWLFGGDAHLSTSTVRNDLWKFSFSGVALPVEFLKLSAVESGNDIRLNWSTVNAQNSKYYTI